MSRPKGSKNKKTLLKEQELLLANGFPLQSDPAIYTGNVNSVAKPVTKTTGIAVKEEGVS